MSEGFQGKVALVTGAATGLGETIAETIFALGASVVAADINISGVEAVARRLDPDGRRALAIHVDVADPATVRAMVATAVSRFGALHLAVNNAGTTGPHDVPLAETSLEDWSKIVGVNLSGVFYGMKYEIPAIIASGGGSIVNMSSGAGAVGQAGVAPYSATKHGIVGLTRSAALDYANHGVRINAIGPGYIDTPEMQKVPQGARDAFVASMPLGRFGQRSEVADMTIFLLSERASFITGGFFMVDGGLTAQ